MMIKNVFASNAWYIILLFVAIGDLVVPFLLAPFSGKYNHLTMVMSVLGNINRPLHSLYSSWLVIAGIGFILGGIKLFSVFSSTSKPLAWWLLVILFLYAIGACILSGLFPVGDSKDLTTLSAKIHGVGSVLGFMVLTMCPFVISLLSFREKELSCGILSLVFFVGAIFFFVLFVMADKEQYAKSIISYEGLWQRLCLLCMYAPIIIVSFKRLFLM